MIEYNLQDRMLKKDVWVKDMLKCSDPEQIAQLISKRIINANFTGPSLSYVSKEEPHDIICFLCNKDDESRKKIVTAIGLILHTAINDTKYNNVHLMNYVFLIINDCYMVECCHLLTAWTKEKQKLSDSASYQDRLAFKTALGAFAKIQGSNPELIGYWKELWLNNSEFWWDVAFKGLRKQDPVEAVKQLPLLIARGSDKMDSIIYSAWKDQIFRLYFERAVLRSINERTGWGSWMIHTLYPKLSDEGKKELISNLKGISL